MAVNFHLSFGKNRENHALTLFHKKQKTEIDIYLKKGEVKFRARDSWAQNWGAIPGNDELMSAEGIQDGANIVISEEGNYHVILNLTSNMYQFIKQDD